MKLLSLPIGLWALSILVLSTAASPVDAKAKKPKKPPAPPIGKQLTLQDFNVTIEHDFWFVEFYSPNCPHCKRFAPTWKEFTEGHKDVPKLNFAQVNCIVQGDLCNSQGIKGYPELNLFHDGGRIAQFDDERLIPKLDTWLSGEMAKIQTVVSTPASEPSAPTLVDQAKNMEEGVREVVQKDGAHEHVHEQSHDHVHEHDHIAHEHEHGHELEHKHLHDIHANELVLPVGRNFNPSGTVLSLSPATFENALADGPIFVKFFAPWCGHCKKLAPTWTQIASKMRGILTIAEVNCDEHKGLCRSQGVQGYPQLFFYAGGKKIEYSGSRSYDALEKYVIKAVAPAVDPVAYASFKKMLNDEDVFMVYLHNVGDNTYDKLVEEASKPLMGSPTIVKSSDSRIIDAYSTVHAPAVAVFKSGGLHEVVKLSEIGRHSDTLSNWMIVHRLPLALELSPDNFQEVMKSPAHPLVVLTAYDPTVRSVETDVRGFAAAWNRVANSKSRPTVHVWMDGSRWAQWLSSMYGISSSALPAVVIVDHSRLIYYDTDAAGRSIKFESESVQRALEDVQRRATRPKYSENIVERLVRWIGDTLDASFFAVQNNILLSLVGFGALLVVASAGLRRCLRVDRNVYVQHHASRLD